MAHYTTEAFVTAIGASITTMVLRVVSSALGVSGDRSQCLLKATAKKVTLQINFTRSRFCSARHFCLLSGDVAEDNVIELTHYTKRLKVELPFELVVANALDEGKYVKFCRQAGDLDNFPVEVGNIVSQGLAGGLLYAHQLRWCDEALTLIAKPRFKEDS
ncbi:hypothetical protein ACLOJK_033353 [Asimina triloba]